VWYLGGSDYLKGPSMALRVALLAVVAASLSACAPSGLEGYDSILCSGSTVDDQLGIDLEHREYGMLGHRAGFIDCSTGDYDCMVVPLVVSMPKDRNTPLDRPWRTEGIEFRYEQIDAGFQIVAMTVPNDLSPRSEIISISRFSEDGDLIEVVRRRRGEPAEVQRVCRGRINLRDLF
jgi:hypothetical protein